VYTFSGFVTVVPDTFDVQTHIVFVDDVRFMASHSTTCYRTETAEG